MQPLNSQYPVNPRRVALAHAPTPLQFLPKVSEHLGGPRVWVKRDDLTGSALSGNKVRKLEYLLADAQGQNADVLITCGGVQSNHCRATALVAAQAGLASHLILRGAPPADVDGNLFLDRLAGATVSYYPAPEYTRDLIGILQHWQDVYREQGKTAYVIPTGGSNDVGLWGYLTAAQEMHEQFAAIDLQPEYVVCASGSGGTQAGLTLGFHLLRPQLTVMAMAVCDNAAYFEAKVRADIAAWSEKYAQQQVGDAFQIHTNDRYIGSGYGIAQPDVLDTIAWLARTEGLVLDPVYTGKAFYGLMQEVAHGALRGAKDVVFVHTGGMFGLFPFREQMAGHLSAAS